ncbi:MAG: hypothetical protein ACLPRE_11670 [Limisphaerales bacterium]
MSAKEIREAVKRLTKAEQEALRDWLENLLEDRLELKEEFKAEIEAGEKDIAEGRYRVRNPKVSRQLEVAKDVVRRYRHTLRELAK